MEMVYLMVFILSVLSGFPRLGYSCLTWDIEDFTLQLTCRLENFVQPVSFINPLNEEVAGCVFGKRIRQCVTHEKNGNITKDSEQMKLIFSLQNIDQHVNGEWTCVQGNNSFKTTVSTKRGIIDATDLNFSGELFGSNKIKLTCSSCREPHGNYVEFLIDGRSNDSLTYSHETGKCKRGNRMCTPDVCSCSICGNEFTRIFPIGYNNTKQNFSCEMRFIDRLQLYRFLLISTLFFNGSDFISIFNESRKTKMKEKEFVPPYVDSQDSDTSTSSSVLLTTSEKSKKEKGNGNQGKIIGIFVGFSVIIIIGFLVVVFFCNRKGGNYCKSNDTTEANLSDAPTTRGHENSRQEEGQPLLGVSNTHERKDIPQKRKSKSNQKKYCEPCFGRSHKTLEALYWCIECSEMLCESCKVYHKNMKSCRYHKFISSDIIPENYSLSTTVVCTQHENMKQDYICNDHDELCCKECVDTAHKRCDTKPIILYDLESNLTNLVEQQTSQIDQKLKELEDYKAEIVRSKYVCDKDADEIVKTLNQVEDRGSGKSSMASELLEILEKMRKTRTSNNAEVIRKMENLEDRLNEQNTFIDFTKQYCSKMQLLILIYSTTTPLLKNADEDIKQMLKAKSNRDSYLEPEQHHQIQVAIGKITTK